MVQMIPGADARVPAEGPSPGTMLEAGFMLDLVRQFRAVDNWSLGGSAALDQASSRATSTVALLGVGWEHVGPPRE